MTEDTEFEIPFLQHLDELRSILLKCLIGICIVAPFIFYFHDPIQEYYLKNFSPEGHKLNLNYFGPMDPLIIKLKVTLFLSFFISSPYIAYKLWSFIAPGLYSNEKSALIKFSIASWCFFLIGITFSILFIIPSLLAFSLGFQTEYLHPILGIKEFINLSLVISFGFGLMFQFPIAIFLLTRTGIVSPESLSSKRPFIILIIFVLSALLTPPDIFSQLMMGIPTTLLFEASLLLSKFTAKKKTVKNEEPDDVFFDTETGNNELDVHSNADSTVAINLTEDEQQIVDEDSYFDFEDHEDFDHNDEHFFGRHKHRRPPKRSIRYIKGVR